MCRVFITGSSDGLGRMAARLLIARGDRVVLHARNAKRRKDVLAAVPDAEAVVVGDLSSISETLSVAEQVNRLGPFDAVIHDAAIGYRERKRVETEDGLPQVFAMNTLAPYPLTALIEQPKRLVYLSSGLHRDVNTTLEDMLWCKRRWHGSEAYAETNSRDSHAGALAVVVLGYALFNGITAFRASHHDYLAVLRLPQRLRAPRERLYSQPSRLDY